MFPPPTKINNPQGFAITQVLLFIGVLSALSMGHIKLQEIKTRSIKTVVVRNRLNEFVSDIENNVTFTHICKNTFKNAPFFAGKDAGQTFQIEEVLNSNSDPLYALDDLVGQNRLVIEDMSLKFKSILKPVPPSPSKKMSKEIVKSGKDYIVCHGCKIPPIQRKKKPRSRGTGSINKTIKITPPKFSNGVVTANFYIKLKKLGKIHGNKYTSRSIPFYLKVDHLGEITNCSQSYSSITQGPDNTKHKIRNFVLPGALISKSKLLPVQEKNIAGNNRNKTINSQEMLSEQSLQNIMKRDTSIIYTLNTIKNPKFKATPTKTPFKDRDKRMTTKELLESDSILKKYYEKLAKINKEKQKKKEEKKSKNFRVPADKK
jgi:hypothetical protein